MKITVDMINVDADIFFIEGYMDAAYLHGSVISVGDAKRLLDRVGFAAQQKINFIHAYFSDPELVSKWYKIVLDSQEKTSKKIVEMTVI